MNENADSLLARAEGLLKKYDTQHVHINQPTTIDRPDIRDWMNDYMMWLAIRPKPQLPPLQGELLRILSFMQWTTVPIAHRLRELRMMEIPTKCEIEQAFALHWCINLWMLFGDEWTDKANEILKRPEATAATSPAATPESAPDNASSGDLQAHQSGDSASHQ